MKTKLLSAIFMFAGVLSYGQFTTGTVTLTAGMTLRIDTNATTVALTLTGPSTSWLGIGFNGTSMSAVTDMFIWNASANRDYTPSGGQSTPSADAAQSWTIASDNVASGTRTVVASRPLASAGDYTFLNDASSLPIIFALSNSTTLGFHSGVRTSATLPRTSLGVEDFSLRATQIFPNPSNGAFSVKTKTSLEKINVYTQTGAFVKTIVVEDSSETAEVNITELQTGIYLIELVNDNEKAWKKVIVE